MRTAMIIGSGIGGLTLAALLRASGWQLTLHERALALPTSGTTLAMWPSAMAVLDQLGLGDRVRDLGRPQHDGLIRRASGARIAQITPSEEAWLINRPDLLAALAEVAGEIVYGHDIPNPDDQRAAAADVDLLVGADGVHSVVRQAITSQPVRRPGLTIWRGWADLKTSVFTETWGPGALFGASVRPGGRISNQTTGKQTSSEQTDDSTNWYAMIAQPPSVAPQELPTIFSSWHGGVRKVIDAIDPESIIRHEGLSGPTMPSYVRAGNPGEQIALIGDAAHAMGPNLGRGACEALVDAAELAEQLTRHDVHQALVAYDRRRRPATRRIQRASMMTGRIATARRFLGVRNLAARAAASLS